MFLKTAQIKYFQALLASILLSVTTLVFADDQTQSVFSTIGNTQTSTSSQNQTTNNAPNSSVSLDFSKTTAESWDEKDQPANMIVQCINGDTITGVEYTNVTIETVGSSFFSEAVIYFSDSNDNAQGLKLQIGSGNESSGVAVFNSNGIVDITDSGNLDIVSLADNKFIIQFFENIDDEQGAIDARFTNGILKVWGVDLTAVEGCPFNSSTQGQQGSDLAVEYRLSTTGKSISASSKTGTLGDTLVFDIIVTNNSPIGAVGVVIENTLSSNLDFVQFSCDDGTNVNSPASIASVNVNDIAGMGTLNCTLSATIAASGTIDNSVTVTATNDPGGVNNTAAIVLAGAHIVVPMNNVFTLLLMFSGLLLLARKYNKV